MCLIILKTTMFGERPNGVKILLLGNDDTTRTSNNMTTTALEQPTGLLNYTFRSYDFDNDGQMELHEFYLVSRGGDIHQA